ncbi:MAG: DUF4438 domain-containing protein [Nitrospirae bacterium]|nr:DUF4438 domain-containing protein [Nitrospirota bacterium]
MTLRTNEDRLVKFAVQGSVVYARCFGWELASSGVSLMLPSVGGITFNVKVGDTVFGWAGDHIEPCVSFSSDPKEPNKDPNRAFNTFSCIGNEAVVISGDAKGAKGVVTGHHGGVEHVIADFDEETLGKLTQDDKILVRAYGQGLSLEDYPEIKVFSMSPEVLKKTAISAIAGGRIEVPVTAIVPGKLMGSGLGHNDVYKGDYDIQTSDAEAIKRHKLEGLRLGDFVAIQDHDSSYGWTYREGAVTIGIVIHTDSYLAGHGPGVQTIMTSARPLIEPTIDPDANLGIYLSIGRWR